MKPFRGKPEKPKRSNGEIHRQHDWLLCGLTSLFGISVSQRAELLQYAGLSACTSPLVERRDPLSVGLRSRWLPVLSHLFVYEADPWYSDRLLDGTRKVLGRTI